MEKKEKKVILICIDGMRPDGLEQCGHPYVEELKKICTWTYTAQTVMPSATLPAHMSMVLSVTPQKHGILTNSYTPPLCRCPGLFEKILGASGYGRSAMVYNWEPIRDIARPNSLGYALHVRGYSTNKDSDLILTDAAEQIISAKLNTEKSINFAFLYYVDTDEAGHRYGWMGEEYLDSIHTSVDIIKRVIEKFGDEYSIVVMADHGGHDTTHGTEMPEDMIIPLFFYGPDFEPGKEIKGGSILDIAPTITKIMGIEPDEMWEGRPLF